MNRTCGARGNRYAWQYFTSFFPVLQLYCRSLPCPPLAQVQMTWIFKRVIFKLKGSGAHRINKENIRALDPKCFSTWIFTCWSRIFLNSVLLFTNGKILFLPLNTLLSVYWHENIKNCHKTPYRRRICVDSESGLKTGITHRNHELLTKTCFSDLQY